MNVLELSEQEIIRRNSMNELRAMGIEPYPAAEYVTNAFSTDIKAEFKDDAEPRKVSVAGRMMTRRVMGKASFIELQDSKGRIQVYITRDDICPGEDKDLYNTVFKRLLDLGDFIGIEGFVFRTQMGEISIHAQKLTVLAKSIKPLPIVKYKDGVAYDSFEDPELRYRQRYVDLVVNDGVKETFLKRATVIKTMRAVLDEAGYTEVETPILQSIAGGASARPFITHHNSLNMDLYLRIATELYLKRLIVGGFEGVYEIGKNFRNEGMDKNHNPEFTCLELYVQYKDYNWMMSFTEKLLERICIAVNGSEETTIDGKTISFKAPYRRLPILDAIKEKTGYDLNGKSEEEIRQVCKELKMEIDDTMGKGKLIDEIFGEFCEGTFIQPTFITDYPVEMSPLTKMHRSKPGLTERFELMVNGKELANVLNTMVEFIRESRKTGKSCFDELYYRLTSAEHHIGLRKGLIPIYLAAVIHEFKRSVLITDRFGQVATSTDTLLQINAEPKNFYISYLDWNPEKEQFVNNLAALFKEHIIDAEKANNSYEYVVMAMRRWYMSLPKYAKEIKKTISGDKVDKRYLSFVRLLRQNVGAHEFLFEKMPEAFGYAAEFTPGVYENVAAAKNYFDSVMDTLRSSLIQEVKELFGSSKSKRFEMTSLASVIKDWCEVLDTTVFEQLFPDGTEKCLMLFRSVTNDEDTFIARLAKIATDLRLEDWDDSTHGRFTRNVSRYKDTAEQYHAKAEEKNEAEAENNYQVTFIDESGTSSTKRFDRVEITKRGKLLLNAITSDIESMGHSISEQEKRQILMEVLKKLC